MIVFYCYAACSAWVAAVAITGAVLPVDVRTVQTIPDVRKAAAETVPTVRRAAVAAAIPAGRRAARARSRDLNPALKRCRSTDPAVPVDVKRSHNKGFKSAGDTCAFFMRMIHFTLLACKQAEKERKQYVR